MILNCNGLKGIDYVIKFEVFLDLYDFDFVFGIEFELCFDILSYFIFLYNYIVFRKDRN